MKYPIFFPFYILSLASAYTSCTEARTVGLLRVESLNMGK